MIELVTCCLCGQKIDRRQAHNPWPLNEKTSARCCNECNRTKVLPARERYRRWAQEAEGINND